MVCGSRRLAIRVNGKYEEDIILEGNATTLHGVKVSESNLKVTLSGIENLPSGDEYTYELWVWVEEESWNAFTEQSGKHGLAETVTERTLPRSVRLLPPKVIA